MIVIYADSIGDPSVGIPPVHAIIQIQGPVLDEDLRELIRGTLELAFGEIFDDGRTRVRFSDEPEL